MAGMGEDRARDTAQDATRDPASDRVTIQEAARRSGVKEDAIRKRIQRGSIRHQKDPEGRVWVWVPPARDATQDAGAASQDESRYTSKDAAQDGRVEDLREQVAYLRRQLDDEREARRRADEIIARLSQATTEQARTIRALEAPREEPPDQAEEAETVEEAPEPRESDLSPGPTDTTTGGSAGRDAYTQRPRRSLWRRIFDR